MAEPRRAFHRAGPELRKDALIAATLRLMARGGPEATTVRAIADEADVTQGLIRHYFLSKEELINAAYERHMANQLAMVQSGASQSEPGSARKRLVGFVEAVLTAPVMDAEAIAIWAGFIHMVKRDERMRATHRLTYLQVRDCLEDLIREVFEEIGEVPDSATLRRHAIACNAVLDGLWLEGGVLPEAFAENELTAIGIRSVGAILGMPLDTGTVSA